MGIGTVKNAKRIVLLAWGVNKNHIIKKTIEGTVSSYVPASYLQDHNNTTFILDVTFFKGIVSDTMSSVRAEFSIFS